MSHRKTPHRIAAIAALSLVALAACGGGTTEVAGPPVAAEADPLDELSAEDLLAQAVEEGEVVVYSFTSRIAEVEEAFEAEYPGIDLIGNDISATEQIARIKAEDAADTPGAR